MTELMKKLRNCDRNDYGKALTAVINELGLSKKEASELIGCNYTSLSSWCAGGRYPTRTRNHIYEVLESLMPEE